MPSTPKVVIDTNLIIAARWKQGSASEQLLKACAAGRLTLLWSQATRKESLFILGKVRPSPEYRQFIESLFHPEHEIKDPPAVKLSEDPDDDKFLAVALAGAADCVISSDKHLLDLQQVQGIPIIRSGAAARQLNL